MRGAALILGLAAAIGAGAARADVKVTESFRFYTIDGLTQDEIEESVSRDVPPSLGKRAWAFAAWNITWTYTPVSLPDRCWATNVKIEVTARITFPRHRHVNRMDEEMRRKWDGMMAALYRHEKQHVQHGIEAATKIDAQIPTLREADCEALRRKADAVARGLIREGADLDDRYDAETDHGRLEGTWFE